MALGYPVKTQRHPENGSAAGIRIEAVRARGSRDRLQKGSSDTIWKIPRSAWLFALSFNLSTASVGDYLDMRELKLVSC